MKRRIAAAPNDEVHPLVLAILEAVWRATGRRRLPYYVSLDSVRLRPDIEGNETAIMLAALSGWLTVGGKPPDSVAITEDGRRLLKERGLA
jgi:hypothetical protein